MKGGKKSIEALFFNQIIDSNNSSLVLLITKVLAYTRQNYQIWRVKELRYVSTRMYNPG